ncbi:hypothetical protein [Marinobacter persicus]|uniref:Uncharacterized protein n=1 Tax=Marinobacter persicus TaxID=930118 RepID=A0A2S6G1W9_9GAMM|nr:hypothetical protein [Marinobacter persicus]PPK49815.1 hypothetical protein BY455_1533 [Marinobacter persicus]PPK50974.1 hypothetical protein B0H24_10563 [Marinobacter persicus]PPK55580.1 hypothetical protein BY454_1543 [Marinobacter persicus]
MFSSRQTAEIIDKLIELTQHNHIVWRSQDPVAPMIGPDARVDMVYIVNHLGRNIRAYNQNFKYYLDEEKYVWDEQIIVEFVDDYGAVLGRLPRTPNAWDLLKAIQFQNPQINTFYDDLFKS